MFLVGYRVHSLMYLSTTQFGTSALYLLNNPSTSDFLAVKLVTVLARVVRGVKIISGRTVSAILMVDVIGGGMES